MGLLMAGRGHWLRASFPRHVGSPGCPCPAAATTLVSQLPHQRSAACSRLVMGEGIVGRLGWEQESKLTPNPLLLLELKYLHHQPCPTPAGLLWCPSPSPGTLQKHHVPASGGRALSSVHSAWQIPRISHPQTLLWFLNHMQLPPKKKTSPLFCLHTCSAAQAHPVPSHFLTPPQAAWG